MSITSKTDGSTTITSATNQGVTLTVRKAADRETYHLVVKNGRETGVMVHTSELVAALRDQGLYVTTLEEAQEKLAERYILIDRQDYPFTENDIREFSGSKDVQAGSGPELVTVGDATLQNPNWVWNAGINMLRIAEWLESKDTREADKLAARRDALAERFTGFEAHTYDTVTVALKTAIDYAIEMEDKR